MTQDGTPAGSGFEELIRRSMAGEPVDVVTAMLDAVLVVPSAHDIGPHFEGFTPVLYQRDGAQLLAVFTSLALATRVQDVAGFAISMTGRDLVQRMAGGHGIVVNPGHDVGFELAPDTVARITARLRDGTMTGAELESAIQRAMAGEDVDMSAAFFRTELVVPSGAEVGPGFQGFVPVLFDRQGTPMLAVFTSTVLLAKGTDLATHAYTMTGRDLLRRMPGGHGVVLNPRHHVGLELLPDVVVSLARQARED